VQGRVGRSLCRRRANYAIRRHVSGIHRRSGGFFVLTNSATSWRGHRSATGPAHPLRKFHESLVPRSLPQKIPGAKHADLLTESQRVREAASLEA
jgi:hypothetical protein